jgi:hypothetical protein
LGLTPDPLSLNGLRMFTLKPVFFNALFLLSPPKPIVKIALLALLVGERQRLSGAAYFSRDICYRRIGHARCVVVERH